MAKKEIMKNKTDEELAKSLVEARTRLRTERFAAAGARPKDPNAPGKIRKSIARIFTEQRVRSASATASASLSSRSAK